MRHEGIVSLVGITTDPNTDEIMLVMEYMENGSLEDLLVRDKVQVSRDDVIKIGLDIAQGLQFLHAQKIIHRDLKSANVLVRVNSMYMIILIPIFINCFSCMTTKRGPSCQTLELSEFLVRALKRRRL